MDFPEMNWEGCLILTFQATDPDNKVRIMRVAAKTGKIPHSP
jgi:hypothetical protein